MSATTGATIDPWEGRRLTTDAEVAAVSTGTVVRAADGTIAARFDVERGVVFGDDRPFPWRVLKAPALVLWAASDETTADG